MGSAVVSRRVSPRDFGASVHATLPHANRACTQSSHEGSAYASNHRRGSIVPTVHMQKRTASAQSMWGTRMTTIIESLETVSLEEALGYLDSAEGDELAAATALAKDRNLLDGSEKEPDEAEVHHALFLLRRARGLTAPSFDLMRIQLRQRVAA